MPPILRNILAVIAGFVVGSTVNMAIITVLDLIGAYLPMGYIGGMLGGAKKPEPIGGKLWTF